MTSVFKSLILLSLVLVIGLSTAFADDSMMYYGSNGSKGRSAEDVCTSMGGVKVTTNDPKCSGSDCGCLIPTPGTNDSNCPNHDCYSVTGFIGGVMHYCGPDAVWNEEKGACTDPGRPKNGGRPDPGQCAGNPINIATGNKFQTETDYSDPGSRLSVTRSYNSDFASYYADATAAWSVAGLGKTATNVRHETVSLGNSASTWIYFDEIHFQQVDGKTHTLTTPTRAEYTADVRNSGALDDSSIFSKVPEPFYLTRVSYDITSSNYFSVIYWDGVIEYYPYSGPITQKRWPDGTYLNYRYTFNAQHQIMKAVITDHHNRSITVEYTAILGSTTGATQVVDFIDPNGKTTRYTYNATNLLEYVIFPDDDTDDTNNPRKQYLYEDARFPSALTGIIDETGQRYATWAYDAQGRANYSAHGNVAGDSHRFEEVSLVYNADGTTTVTSHWDDGETKSAIYSFEKINDYLKTTTIQGDASTSCSGSTKSYSYDSTGFQDKISDFNGNITDYDFNSYGQLVRRTEGLDATGNSTPATRVFETDYDPNLGLVVEKRLLGSVKTHYAYSANNWLTSRTETDLSTASTPYYSSGQSRIWTYTYTYYDAAQLQVATLTIDGPRTDVSDVTEYDFDTQGNLTQYKNALGQTVRLSKYTGSGLPQTVIDKNNLTTTLQYTARGWLKSSSLATPEGTFATNYSYYGNGLLKRVTLPDNAWLEYSYNAARHLTLITNNLGETISYTPNKHGEWKTETVNSTSGSIVRQRNRTFDELGRLKTVLGNANQFTEYAYDNETDRTGMDQHRLNGSGNAEVLHTSYGYDALNRLQRITDPLSNTVVIKHNAQDQVTSVTDPRQNTTSYVYNGFGQKLKETSPEAGTRYFGYDSAGNATLQQDAAGRLIHSSYDALNRFTQETHDADSTLDVVYSYDEGVNGKGHLTSVYDASTRLANGTNPTRYEYDGRGDVSAITTTLQGMVYRTVYTYTANNEVATITYPSGRVVEYLRNPGGHVYSVVTRATANSPNEVVAQSIQYLPFGPINSLAYGNGLVRSLGYDLDYRLSSLATSDTNQSVQNLHFGYDWLNNITSITDGRQSSHSQAFIYDPLQRVSDATGVYGHYVYGYDSVGNRTSLHLDVNGATQFNESYHYPDTSNRLDTVTRTQSTGSAGRSLGYDSAGNLINDSHLDGVMRQYSFGANNRLTGITDNGAATVSYVHNALGQRVVKTVTGHTATHFQYGLSGELLVEQQGSQQLREYIYLDGQVIAANITPAIVSQVSGSLPADGSNQTFTPSSAGQIANYSFTATAGQSYSILLSNDTLAGNTAVTVYKPDGTQLAATAISYSSGTGTGTILLLSNLASNGNYTVQIQPASTTASGSISVAIRQGLTNTMLVLISSYLFM